MQARVVQEPGSSRDFLDDMEDAGRDGVEEMDPGSWVVASLAEGERKVRDAVEVRCGDGDRAAPEEHEKSEPASSTEEAGEP
jgi:hypothetical protein